MQGMVRQVCMSHDIRNNKAIAALATLKSIIYLYTTTVQLNQNQTRFEACCIKGLHQDCLSLFVRLAGP